MGESVKGVNDPVEGVTVETEEDIQHLQRLSIIGWNDYGRILYRRKWIESSPISPANRPLREKYERVKEGKEEMMNGGEWK